jgi:hypothetical protein
MNMWLALSLKKTAEVSAFGRTTKIPISGMADGCTGCLLAFETREAAAEYAGEGGNIIEIDYVGELA